MLVMNLLGIIATDMNALAEERRQRAQENLCRIFEVFESPGIEFISLDVAREEFVLTGELDLGVIGLQGTFEFTATVTPTFAPGGAKVSFPRRGSHRAQGYVASSILDILQSPVSKFAV